MCSSDLIASAMKRKGSGGLALYDEEDGFFYDVLRHDDGSHRRFRVRSLVGLIPLFAVERIEEPWVASFKEFRANLAWFLTNRREMVADVIHRLPARDGTTTHLLTIVNERQLRRMLTRLHDPEEFLAPHGIQIGRAHV